MRKLVLLSTTAALVMLTGFNANATTNVTADSQAKVTIVDAVAMDHETGKALDFGTAMSAINHTITIDPATGEQTSSDEGQIVTEGDRDHFTVTVPADMNLTITLPGESLSLGTGLSVTQFTSSPAGTLNATKDGPNDIYVGGTLAVSQGAASGDYAQSYTLTISY